MNNQGFSTIYILRERAPFVNLRHKYGRSFIRWIDGRGILLVDVHIVVKGDTLWKIARQYGIPFEDLKRVNAHLANPDYIVPGMKIFLPKKKASPPPSEKAHEKVHEKAHEKEKQHHAPQHHAPQHHAPQHHAPQHHAPQHHAPQHHAPQHHAPQHHAPHHEHEKPSKPKQPVPLPKEKTKFEMPKPPSVPKQPMPSAPVQPPPAVMTPPVEQPVQPLPSVPSMPPAMPDAADADATDADAAVFSTDYARSLRMDADLRCGLCTDDVSKFHSANAANATDARNAGNANATSTIGSETA